MGRLRQQPRAAAGTSSGTCPPVKSTPATAEARKARLRAGLSGMGRAEAVRPAKQSRAVRLTSGTAARSMASPATAPSRAHDGVPTAEAATATAMTCPRLTRAARGMAAQPLRAQKSKYSSPDRLRFRLAREKIRTETPAITSRAAKSTTAPGAKRACTRKSDPMSRDRATVSSGMSQPERRSSDRSTMQTAENTSELAASCSRPPFRPKKPR